jgi:hypothetical protein
MLQDLGLLHRAVGQNKVQVWTVRAEGRRTLEVEYNADLECFECRSLRNIERVTTRSSVDDALTLVLDHCAAA